MLNIDSDSIVKLNSIGLFNCILNKCVIMLMIYSIEYRRENCLKFFLFVFENAVHLVLNFDLFMNHSVTVCFKKT